MYLCMFDTLEMDESDKVLFSIGPGFSSIPDIIKSIAITTRSDKIYDAQSSRHEYKLYS
jgi:hypothetical protein